MFRRMYNVEYFSHMQAAAMPFWRELESESHSKLLHARGLLFYGRPDTGESKLRACGLATRTSPHIYQCQDPVSLQGCRAISNARAMSDGCLQRPGETVEGSVPSSRAVVETLGISHTRFDSPAELNAHWPVNAQPGDQGIFEPGAGYIHVRPGA